jgi:tetratricopeptide (TPR) repeat protein
MKWLEQLAADPVAGREPNVHYQLAMACVDAVQTASPVARSRLTAKALTELDAALARNPELWDARYAKGLVYLRMPASFNQHPNAIATFTELLAYQTRTAPRPEFALTYLHLSEAYLQGGDKRHAAAVLRDGLQRFPDQPLLRDRLGSLAHGGQQP